MIHQMAKTLLRFGFFLGPYILQNRFFQFTGKRPRIGKKNVRFPSALYANFLEVENPSCLAWCGLIAKLGCCLLTFLLIYLFGWSPDLAHKGLQRGWDGFFPWANSGGWGLGRAMLVISMATISFHKSPFFASRAIGQEWPHWSLVCLASTHPSPFPH